MHKHKYHFFSKISNANKTTEAKVLYFFDCLDISFNFINKHYLFPCENHKTILTSILFQIKYNNPLYAKRHLIFYLTYFFELFKGFQILDYNCDVLKQLDRYMLNLEEKEKPNFKQFENGFQKLLNELEESYFSKCLEKIRNHLNNSEDLDDTTNNNSVKDCVFEHSKLLAVEFYLTQASKEDIENIIPSICNTSKEYRYEKHLKHIENKEEYYKNRTFIEQVNEIELIYKLFKKEQTITFFISPDLKLEDVDITILDVVFSKTKPDYIDTDFLNRYKNIINDKTIYATTKIKHNHSETIHIARKKVENALQILNGFIKKHFDNFKYFIIDEAYCWKDNKMSFPYMKSIDFKNQDLKDKIYEYHRQNKKIINKDNNLLLLNNDEIFIKETFSQIDNEVLTKLWFYLETFGGNADDTIKYNSNKLKERFYIDFIDEMYKFLYKNYFARYSKPIYVNDIDVHSFSSNNDHFDKLLWFKNTRKFKHYILCNLLIKSKVEETKELERFRKFLENYLNQVYCYRNFYVHSLQTNENFMNKNLNLFKKIVGIARQETIKETVN